MYVFDLFRRIVNCLIRISLIINWVERMKQRILLLLLYKMTHQRTTIISTPKTTIINIYIYMSKKYVYRFILWTEQFKKFLCGGNLQTWNLHWSCTNHSIIYRLSVNYGIYMDKINSKWRREKSGTTNSHISIVPRIWADFHLKMQNVYQPTEIKGICRNSPW